MKVKFYLLGSKESRETGLAPVYCRITHNKRRALIATNIIVTPNNWGQKEQTVYGPDEENGNTEITLLRSKITSCYLLLKSQNKSISAAVLKAMAVKEERILTVKEVIDEYYKEVVLANDEIVEETKKNYRTQLNNVEDYLRSIKQSALTVDMFSDKLLDNFKKWIFKTKSSTCDAYYTKHMFLFKALEKFAYTKKYTDRLNLLAYKAQHGKKVCDKVPYVIESEFEHFMSYVFKSPKLERVADLFKFQCYTGMAYCDMKKFKKEMITNIRGTDFIIYYRTKTKIPGTPVLWQQAKDILEKYNYKLPVISNQKYNDYLKVIGEFCGISVNLTTHVGRKTFGMRMLNEYDFDMIEVSRMLGHASINMTEKIYAKVSPERIAKRFEAPEAIVRRMEILYMRSAA